jgi:hypothetical protein
MATGKSGSFELAGTKGMTLKVFWSETYDISTNKSVVSITNLQLKTAYYATAFYPNGTIKIGGKTAITFDSIMGYHKFDCITTGGYWSVKCSKNALPWNVGDIVHDSDGRKSVSIAVDIHGYTVEENAGNAWYVSATKSVELTTIPRASAITSAADVTLGNKCSVKWTPLATSFRYKLKFSLGNWSYTTGAIHPNTTSAYTYSGYTIPMEVANQIPSSASGTMTVTLYTYSDSGATTQVGSASSKTFTVKVPSNSNTQPAVLMSLAPVSSLGSAFNGLYIQGKTKVKATLSATGKYGASIKSYNMKAEGTSYPGLTSGYLSNYGSIKVYGEALDSRAIIGSTNQDITVIPYSKPSITVSVCGRCDENGDLSDSGTYLKIKATRSYSLVTSGGVQKNFCQIRYRYKAVSASTYSDWNTILASNNLSSNTVETEALLGGVLAVEKTYEVQVQAIDDIGEYGEATFSIPTEAVHTHRAKNGIGFGKYCEGEKLLDVGWDAHFHGEIRIGEDGMTLKEYILAVISEGG